MRLDKSTIRIHSVAFVMALMCALPFGAEAKTLYVNSVTGNDSITYAKNSQSNAWRTIGRASWGSTSYSSSNANQAARAGDTVIVAAGTYWEGGDPQGGRFSVSLNPVNNGTSGSPITFRGEGTVYIRILASYRGAMIGCSSRDYIIWDHFVIDDYYGGSTSDTGPVVFFTSNHCQLINSEVIAHRGSYYHGYSIFDANYRGISLEPAYFTTIRNNRIHGFNGAAGGIISYDSDDNIIEHNEVYDSKLGIYFKGMHTGYTMARNIIRFNYVHDCTRGIQTESTQDTLIYQNVVVNSSSAGLYAGALGGPTRSRFINNTVYQSAEGSAFLIETNMREVEFQNNIFSNAPTAFSSWTTANPGLQSFTANRNLYFNQSTHAGYASASVSFSSMQSTYGKDINSISGQNPRFVSPANSGGDFHLQSGSPALTLGLDVLDLNHNGSVTDLVPAGAYVTGTEVIGLLSGSSDVSAPAPPSGVTVTIQPVP
jgi:parallel beta-helix repeat protein